MRSEKIARRGKRDLVADGRGMSPGFPQLTALPGLAGLTQLYSNQASYPTQLEITHTAFSSMQSFKNLICAPSSFNVSANSFLATLDGLQRLATPLTGRGEFVAVESGPFFTPASVAPLAGYAACNGNFSGIPESAFSYVAIPRDYGVYIRTYDDLCAYIAG